jgi:hypothetical protein
MYRHQYGARVLPVARCLCHWDVEQLLLSSCDSRDRYRGVPAGATARHPRRGERLAGSEGVPPRIFVAIGNSRCATYAVGYH